MSAIPFSELRAYAEGYGIRCGSDEFEELKQHIQALDTAHRTYEHEHSKTDDKPDDKPDDKKASK